MGELGHYSLFLAWLLALFGLVSGMYAGRTRKLAWLETTRVTTMLVSVCTLLSFVALAFLFFTDDYTNQYVWQFSNKGMESIYKVSAIWGGMDGSMLLWCVMLTLSGGILALTSSRYPRLLMPWTLAVQNSSALFFLSIVLFATNPFRALKSTFIPPDGNGLNPLLQNPYMAIHPPMLYAGFTTFAIPFAFCMAALLSGRLTNEWTRVTRRWTLVAWAFLTTGIVLGGHWAYLELGWGGFWAWDPVENASFLPWLTGTAYVHTVMVQERKNMLKSWSVWLIVMTYALTVFGTFLTRSGIVQSVHAFASTDVGWMFLVYLGLIISSAAVLTVYRRRELRSEKQIDGFLSREAFFLINNLLLLSICFATFWGVMFPVFSEALTGQKQAVGIPFFNAVNLPLFLALIFAMGVGPLIAWRKSSLQNLAKTFLRPLVIAMGAGLALVWAGIESVYAVASYSICFFVLLTLMGEFYRGLRAQRVSTEQGGLTTAVPQLLRRHRQRYGGYLVHFGVLVATIGITASMAHKTEKEFTLGKGETYEVGRFKLTLDDVHEGRNENYEYLNAAVSVRTLKNDAFDTVMKPELRYYLRKKETTTEVALRMGLREDIYLVVAGTDTVGDRVAFKLFINPLQVWLWIGVLIMLGGTGIVLLPGRQRASQALPVRAAAPVGRD